MAAKGKQDKEQRPVSAQAAWAASERALRRLRQVLEGQEFASAAEAQAFLDRQLRAWGGRIPEASPESPAEEAQELVYKAWEAGDREERLRLARRALELWPDCADAYVVLGEEAESLEEAIGLYREGVLAGERALGDELLASWQGELWELLEGRPYLRARYYLCQALAEAGRLEEAVAHGWELLRLDEGDHQGMRHSLVHWLLERGEVEAAEGLLRRYVEDSPFWRYAWALCLFRKEGDGLRARKALRQAFEANPYVAAALPLLASEEFLQQLPDYYRPGSLEEAIYYWKDGFGAWRAAEEALAWLLERSLSLMDREIRARRQRVGRNELCPCGSGRKYKRCCGHQ